jgi:hypothetical protein
VAESPGDESSLSRGRGLVAARADKEALEALEEAFRTALKQRDIETLREVSALAAVVQGRSTGSLAGKAERLGYATAQNIRGLERRAVAEERERIPKPSPRDWLEMGIWALVVTVVAFPTGDAFVDQLVGDNFSPGEFVFGFVVVPLALGLAAGVVIRKRASVIEGLLLAAVGAALLGTMMASRLDLSPGSQACPLGCEEDVSDAIVIVTLIVFLPLAAGVIAGKLYSRKVGP